jgi:hypothetical protein
MFEFVRSGGARASFGDYSAAHAGKPGQGCWNRSVGRRAGPPQTQVTAACSSCLLERDGTFLLRNRMRLFAPRWTPMCTAWPASQTPQKSFTIAPPQRAQANAVNPSIGLLLCIAMASEAVWAHLQISASCCWPLGWKGRSCEHRLIGWHMQHVTSRPICSDEKCRDSPHPDTFEMPSQWDACVLREGGLDDGGGSCVETKDSIACTPMSPLARASPVASPGQGVSWSTPPSGRLEPESSSEDAVAQEGGGVALLDGDHRAVPILEGRLAAPSVGANRLLWMCQKLATPSGTTASAQGGIRWGAPASSWPSQAFPVLRMTHRICLIRNGPPGALGDALSREVGPSNWRYSTPSDRPEPQWL